jgi:hypothetical protein
VVPNGTRSSAAPPRSQLNFKEIFLGHRLTTLGKLPVKAGLKGKELFIIPHYCFERIYNTRETKQSCRDTIRKPIPKTVYNHTHL